MKRVYLLMGGLYSIDGAVTSAGMEILVSQLRALPNVVVKTYPWASYQICFNDQNREVSATDKMILIGYSGGGWRATTVANKMAKYKEPVDLMVLYDPSPEWNMEPIHDNVKHPVCYQNSYHMWIPLLGNIGGGILTSVPGGPKIDVVSIKEQHLSVQYDATLHAKTVSLVKSL